MALTGGAVAKSGPVVEAAWESAETTTTADVRLTPSIRWRLTQMAADFTTVFAAVMISYWAYLASGVGRRHFDPALYGQLGFSLAAVTLFALYSQDTYRERMGLLRIESVRCVLQAVGSAVMLLLALSVLMQAPGFSRLTIVILCPTVAMALVGQRLLLARLREQAFVMAGDRKGVIIYGAGDTGRLLAGRLFEEQQLGLEPVGFVDDDPVRRGENLRIGPGVNGRRLPILGGGDVLLWVARHLRAQAVFIALPSLPTDQLMELVRRLERERLRVFFVPNPGRGELPRLTFGQIAGIPVFTRCTLESRPLYEAAKRLVDVIGAGFLLLLAGPLLAGSVLLVCLTSPGPVVFRQIRVGRDGKRFTIFKLRTMRQDAPVYSLHPDRPDDPRLIWAGSWLRRLSIDELPQLLNVLRGDMSLVGPRPEMPFVVAGYTERQAQRLAVKPGLTGLWQISGDRAFRIHDNIHYDLYYIQHRGLWLDLAILFMTPFAVLTREGAR